MILTNSKNYLLHTFLKTLIPAFFEVQYLLSVLFSREDHNAQTKPTESLRKYKQ